MKALKELWDYRYLVWNLAQRDLRSRYKKSVLGWLWSLINPASTLLIFTFVFGIVLGARIDTPAGNGAHNFGLWLFAGLVVWNFFNTTVTGSITALSTSGGLLKKVYFPPTAPALSNLLVGLTQAAIEFAILAVSMVLWGNFSPYFLLSPVVILFTGVFALGLGLWASILNLFYRDIGYLVSVAMNFLFYGTPIVYSLELDNIEGSELFGIPVPTLLRLNPLTNLIDMNRDLFYVHRLPGLKPVLYIVVTMVVSLVFGAYMFNRKAQYVSEEI